MAIQINCDRCKRFIKFVSKKELRDIRPQNQAPCRRGRFNVRFCRNRPPLGVYLQEVPRYLCNCQGRGWPFLYDRSPACGADVMNMCIS